MNLTELQESWSSDCELDETNLDYESLNTPRLHAKYLKELSTVLVKKASTSASMNEMKTLRFRYYRGEMSREELTTHGWEQWQGAKPMKSEMENFIVGDSELNKLKMKMDYLSIMEDTLKQIMGQIKSRDWQIRNAIVWKQYQQGN